VAAELSVKLGIYVFSAYGARLLASRTGATRPSEDLFAELEDVPPHSRPVHHRVRFPGRGDRSVPNYVFLRMEVGTRRIVHCNVTAHARQRGRCSSFAKRFRAIIPTVS